MLQSYRLSQTTARTGIYDCNVISGRKTNKIAFQWKADRPPASRIAYTLRRSPYTKKANFISVFNSMFCVPDRNEKKTVLHLLCDTNKTFFLHFVLYLYICIVLSLPRCVLCRRGLAMRILSVRQSVCPPVERVHCDKTKERSVQIFIPY